VKPVSRDWDEFCYPFIYEDSPICDFEILSDELCCRVGLVLSLELEPQVREILQRLQPNIYHLNGSVRGKLAITESELVELKQDYHHIRDQLEGGFKGFVLPGGALEALRMKPQPWTEARTLGEQPFGTSHWAGTWKGFPALSLSYCGGATLFYFDGEWKKKVFGNLAELHEAIGVSR
jgi:hypothetical protein